MNKEEFIAEAIEYILDDPYDCDEHTCSLIQVQDADDLQLHTPFRAADLHNEHYR